MTVTRWSPVGGLATLEVDGLNRMFNSMFGAPDSTVAWVPAVDIYETANRDVVIKAELPDMKREDIKLTVENNVLTIEGERKVDTSAAEPQYHRRERSYGTFRRSFTLPASVDAGQVQAAYQDGVLTVTLPERADAKPRQINIAG